MHTVKDVKRILRGMMNAIKTTTDEFARRTSTTAVYVTVDRNGWIYVWNHKPVAEPDFNNDFGEWMMDSRAENRFCQRVFGEENRILTLGCISAEVAEESIFKIEEILINPVVIDLTKHDTKKETVMLLKLLQQFEEQNIEASVTQIAAIAVALTQE